MENKLLEIKGKDGSILQLEVNYPDIGGIEYTFYYRNNDIFFMCKDDYCDDGLFRSFKWDLQELLENNPNSSITEKLYQEPDSWLTTQLKKIFPAWSAKTSKPLIKKWGYDSCLFDFIYPDASLECKRIEGSSDYLIEFKFIDSNIVQDIDEGMLILRGSLVVAEEALLNFYRGL